MSRICKLSIRGIRNFDDEHEGPTIHFSRPLTLILGPNGTGKTTIIECLRYVLSGEFPPGSEKGKSFVHDPMLKRLAAIAVRGNVKAEIADVRGDRLIISRTVEAQRVNQTVKFKTLDNAIVRINRRTKEKTQLTGTCAAVDVEVLSSIGVSKAILNYVLFCHQDDSNWPFEDGKRLKERFDQIFDTSRYNKALDVLRKIIKDKQTQAKILTAEQRGLLMIVDEVKSKKRKLKDFETRKNEVAKKINALTSKLKPINQRLAEIKEIETEYCKWQIEEEKKKMEYKLLCHQIRSLREEIKELYEGTTSKLKNEISSYEAILSEKNNQIDELERDLRERAAQEARFSALMDEKRVAMGTLRQQMRDQINKISQRNGILKNMIMAWGLNGDIESDISEQDASEWVRKFEQALRKFEKEIEVKRAEQEEELDILQRKSNTQRAKRTTTESQLASSRRELHSTETEIRANSALLKKSGAMEQKLNEVDRKLAVANSKFEEFNEKSEVDDLKRKMQAATEKEEKYERECNSIEKEIIVLREQSALQMKLESCNTELMEKEKQIEVLRNKHEATLKILLGKTDFPAGGMMDTINEIQIVLNDRIKNLKKEIDSVRCEAAKLEASVKHKREELEKKKVEIQRDKERVSSQCGEYENYRETLLLNSKRLKDIEDKRGMYAYQGAAYKEYIKKLNEPNACCPVCRRGFESQENSKQLAKDMTSEMAGHPERLKKCEKELAAARKKYDLLLQLQPIVEGVEHFEEIEMTKMKTEVEETSKRLSAANKKIKQLQESVLEPERQLSTCKDMIGDMAVWDRYANEIDSHRFSVIEIQDSLREAGLKSDKTIQEAEAEQGRLHQLLKDVRREIKNLQCTLNSRNEELRRITENRTKLLEEQLRIHQELQEIKQAKEKLEQLHSKEISLKETVSNFEDQLIQIGNEYEAANQAFEQAKKKIRSIQDCDREKLRDRSKEFDRLNAMQVEVTNILSRKIDDQLKSVEEKLESTERLANTHKSEKIAREKKLAKMKEDIIAHATKKRDLTDNYAMRQKEIDAEHLKTECDRLREKLVGINHETIARERKTLCERRDITEREKNMAEGNEEELERNIAHLTLELEKNEYRLAYTNYKSKCVELVATNLCVKDLTTYCKVLDKAMIEYHEERMATVNKSMKKLWDLIYTGTDTSSIQIRTEATTMANKRSFNYKFIQIKHGVEMDMKGRCSAGQKVLSSIILRLALAETFCEKCGVLALDEPTTNLDEENSKSLADALHSYVNRRAKFQKNFQLIVITHDDNFIPKLGQLSKNNSFYQLYRYENGMSGIKCVSMDGPSGISRNPRRESSEDEDENERGRSREERSKRGPSNSIERPDRKRARKRPIFE
ncbi:DNA repair protein RAD50 [Venturia canescens]|uniref:DNA repair protein RAD50 n=1 Tax=Venturia canescens TaxID=32260 RepID=UPI001C9C1941|nr:DNA repair protein RAD50 [Venturia canescens]XP_043285324.1 DNA repair protein RAD50 [Venturia canescens]